MGTSFCRMVNCASKAVNDCDDLMPFGDVASIFCVRNYLLIKALFQYSGGINDLNALINTHVVDVAFDLLFW